MKKCFITISILGVIILAILLFFFIRQNTIIVCEKLSEIKYIDEEKIELLIKSSSVINTSYNVISTPKQAAAQAKSSIRVRYNEKAFFHGPYVVYEDPDVGVYYVLAKGFFLFHHSADTIIRKSDGAILFLEHYK